MRITRSQMRAIPPRVATYFDRLVRIVWHVNTAVATRTRPVTEAVEKTEEGMTVRLRRVPLPDRMRRLFQWLAAHPLWEVALLATALSIGVYIWYSAHGLTLAYTDAISHMEIARRIVAGRTPGLAQLGSVWLPLHHLLMLPLIANYTLFHDGFAGTFPSMAAYVVSSIYLFRTGYLLLASHTAGWVAALAFMLNPNVLYMQSTAMTELDMLAAAIVATFYLLQWAHSYHPLDLTKASIAIAAGTLVRYDAWALAVVAAAVVIVVAWRKGGRVAAESYAILFGIMAFAGCIGWFLYNGVIFHDPLYFYTGMYSTQAQQKNIEVHAGLPTHNNPWLSLHVYSQTVIDTVSWPLAILAIVGLLFWMIRARFAMQSIPGYLAFVPFAFNVLALVRGISIIVTPEIPFGAPTYFNVRYGMMMIPAIALCLAFLAVQRRLLLMMVLGLVVIFGVGNSTLGARASTPYVVQDPLYGVGVAGRTTGIQAGKWLADHYQGGHVMITYSNDSAIMFHSGLPDTAFITETNGEQFKHALAAPQDTTTWIVLSPAGSNNEIAISLGKQQKWRRYYVLRQVIDDIQFYERIDSP